MKIINARDFGVAPDTGRDMTEAINRLFEKVSHDAKIVFAPGRYDFSAENALRRSYSLSNSEPLPERKIAMLLRGMTNITLDFTGCSLMFAGHMMPVAVDSCSDITLRGAVIDWEKPLIAEGIVVKTGDDYCDIYVDPASFPYRYADGRLWFDVGAGEEYATNGGAICFEPVSLTVAPGSGDSFGVSHLEPVGEDTYRRRVRGGYIPPEGSVVALRHNDRWHAGIFYENSERVLTEDITFYSCGGLGCLAQFCTDMTFRRVLFTPNTAAGRRVTNGRDDGLHITCCRGETVVEDCAFSGLMDDPINVHGCSVVVESVEGDTARCRFGHPQAMGFDYWARRGDVVAVIDRAKMNPVATATVAEYTPSGNCFTLRFKSDISGALDLSRPLAADNLSAACAVTIRGCRFGSCRARGILVSEPKRILIEDNLFDSSGCAILFSGDCNGWFESGAVHDATVRRNVFTDRCLSSAYQFCDGVISINPVVPEPDDALPFHENIRITDNIFDTPSQPVLYALSTAGLVFERNRIFIAPHGAPWRPGDAPVVIEHCSGASIGDNVIVGRPASDSYRIK